MAKRTITLDLLAKNQTGKAFRDVGRDAQGLSRGLQQAGAAAAAGLAVAGAAAVAFGVQSVRAFAEAQEAQNRLAFALEKFPALADTNVQALQRLNSALMMKTRFDDDAIASGQAVLAQFGLTGDQLERLTPLLLDYAAATGKDLTTSAEDLGRALLGQGRALKVLGVDFSDAGSVAANFDQLMGSLSEKVGGFAERDAETAAGKLDILTNRFGEVQEAVGEALLPALQRLIDWIDGDGLAVLERFADWFAEDGVDALTGFIDKIAEMSENGTLVPNVVAGIGAIAAAQLGLNAAMAANPVGLVIAGLGALASAAVFVVANWNQVTAVVAGATRGVLSSILSVATGMTIAVNNVVNALLSALQPVLGVVNQVLRVLGLPGVALPSRVNFTGGIQSLSALLNSGFAVASQQGVNGLALPSNLSQFGTTTNQGVRVFAEGGIVRATPGGTLGVIGEAGDDEAVIPLSSPTARRLLGGGGGPEINVYVNGWVGGSRADFAKATVRAIQDAVKVGDIPRGALA